jgi:hypothetical protein
MRKAFLVGLLASVVAAAPAAALAQTTGTALGPVNLKYKVKANGEPLAPGTYQVRLTSDNPKPALGQTETAEQWVEFVRGGKVVGKEVVSVVSDADMAQIAEGHGQPRKGGYRVDMLKGNDYVRVWINKAGNNYLIHLPVGA